MMLSQAGQKRVVQAVQGADPGRLQTSLGVPLMRNASAALPKHLRICRAVKHHLWDAGRSRAESCSSCQGWVG